MEEIKKGDFARVGSYGFTKIIDIIRDKKTNEIVSIVDVKNNNIKNKYVQKTNKDFFKLLELGDYINGNKITCEYFFEGVLYRDSNNPKQYDKLVKMKFEEIRNALTHEQYEQSCFITGN